MTRAEAISILKHTIVLPGRTNGKTAYAEALQMATKALEEPQWIPFQTRPLDEDEKESFPDWDSILCGNLPDDGQQILVSVKYGGREYVITDEYYYSGYGECYLESGYDFVTEAVAWMPLPKAYREGEKE